MSIRNLKVYWQIEERLPDGTLLGMVEGECKSLLKNFAAWMYSFMTGTALTAQMKDTAGNTITMTPRLGSMHLSSTDGLVGTPRFAVGTGNNAVTSNDVALQSQQQTATNAVPYMYLVSDTDTSFQYALRQSIVASSSYTIKEVGFFATIKGERDSGGGNWVSDTKEMLLIRDVLGTPYTTTTGSVVTMRFTFAWQPASSSYLKNLALLVRGFLMGQNESLKDTSGSSFTVPIASWGSSSAYGFMGFASNNPKGVIQFGTDSTTPVLGNYVIVARSTSDFISDIITINDATQLAWLTSGAGFFTTTYSICEMAMAVGYADDTTPANPVLHRTLVTRSTFSPIAVVNGDWINGKYIHTIAI